MRSTSSEGAIALRAGASDGEREALDAVSRVEDALGKEMAERMRSDIREMAKLAPRSRLR